ncbi:hypothetical protein BVRB_1g016050 [Beta vulgaris subsp. vulgaris]|nr:hypothetical protein BVRB_1g016050 [Beta vulgaris subsp. vulgaris]
MLCGRLAVQMWAYTIEHCFAVQFYWMIDTSSGQPSIVETELTKSDSATSSEPRSHRKRSRVEEEEGDLQHISAQLGEVVTALKFFSQNPLDVQKLYEEIMKMDDVEEAVCVAAFDHLVEREMLAKAFLTKSEPLRKLWLQNFVKEPVIQENPERPVTAAHLETGLNNFRTRMAAVMEEQIKNNMLFFQEMSRRLSKGKQTEVSEPRRKMDWKLVVRPGDNIPPSGHKMETDAREYLEAKKAAALQRSASGSTPYMKDPP